MIPGPSADHQAPLLTLPGPQAWRWRNQQRRDNGGTGTPGYAQAALALTYALPGGLQAVPGGPAEECGRPGAPSAIPDPEAWASRFLQAVVEVISSDRPVSQLARWTAPSVYEDIQRRQQRVLQHRGRTTGPRPSRQQVATVRVCQPAADVAEVAARVAFGARSRAIAARLDFERDRWTCTALVFG